MKIFHCGHCEQLVFFENTSCVNCGHALAYLPDERTWARSSRRATTSWRSVGPRQRGATEYRLCANYRPARTICNWVGPRRRPQPLLPVVPADPGHPRPEPCRAPARPGAASRAPSGGWSTACSAWISRWRPRPRIRSAAWPSSSSPIPTRARRVPCPVLTGHDNGVITINIAEADDAEREKRRNLMHEPYRTILGHFRHEIGHYYWDRLIRDSRADRRVPPPLRRRAARLRRGDPAPPQARRPADWAVVVRLGLRQLPPVGRLGRDLGPLPAHHRHPGDGRRVRPLPPPQALGRARDEARHRRRRPAGPRRSTRSSIAGSR